MKYKNILTKEFLIEEYWNKNKSTPIIAKEIECSEYTIYSYLRKFNIKIRTNSEAQKNRSSVTEKTKQKMSESKRGEKNHNFGVSLAEETKKKISKTRIKKGIGKGINNSFYGKKHTEDSKQKQRDSHVGLLSGSNNPNFKGRVIDKNGYVYIYSPNHSFKNNHNRVFEQRLIVEKKIGRYLLPTEVVHHVNEIRDDNRIENLICFVSQSAHMRFHYNPNNVKPEEIIFDGREI